MCLFHKETCAHTHGNNVCARKSFIDMKTWGFGPVCLTWGFDNGSHFIKGMFAHVCANSRAFGVVFAWLS